MISESEPISPSAQNLEDEVKVLNVLGKEVKVNACTYGGKYAWKSKFFTVGCGECKYYMDRYQFAEVLEAVFARKGMAKGRVPDNYCGICLWNSDTPKVLVSYQADGTEHKPAKCQYAGFTPDVWWKTKRGKKSW